ncbi:general transcription factor II-I repeat domain-containing protein 2A [Trichonephila clavipes]|nr:general transcription factor II-I repeat domain-containing protein 2A [Trichonephila clavipes]
MLQTNKKSDINSASFISLCLDESIDTTKSARLAVFARYCVGNIIKEELIAITSLLTTTKGTDICTAIRNSLAEKEIDLKKIVSVTTDGAPNMKKWHVDPKRFATPGLDDATSWRIFARLEAGHSKASRVFGVSRNQVSTVWKQCTETGTVVFRLAQDRKRATASLEDRYLRLLAKRNRPTRAT